MLPAVAQDSLQVGAIELSWLLGAAGVGALVGSLVSASLGGFRRRGLLVLGCAATSGVLLLALGFQTLFVPALLLVGLSSFTLQVHIVSHVTVYQERTPERLQGRVVGTSSTLAGSMQAVGALLFGTLGSLFGINVAIALGGLALALGAASILVRTEPLRTA
jgi:MFS family permease